MKKGRATTKRAKRPEPYAEEIDRGVRLLDRRRPAWLKRINLKTLDMESGTDCILGQIWGHFARAIYRFGWIGYRFGWIGSGRKYGFLSALPGSFEDDDITQAWKRRITQLRKARAK